LLKLLIILTLSSGMIVASDTRKSMVQKATNSQGGTGKVHLRGPPRKEDTQVALWKELAKGEPLTGDNDVKSEVLTVPEIPHRLKAEPRDIKDSIISAGLTIEGKIGGDGDVRLEGRFKGDVKVNGSVTIEPGAHIGGEISANNVIVGGHVEGNITATSQVRLLESCELIGDLKASSLTVAAGSRMRGQVEFGWDGKENKKFESKKVGETDPKSIL
jgi:cytoskeletal protein CcmA (bactofilin family)